MAGHGDDVDDGSLDVLAAHRGRGLLHQEEGRAQIDGHDEVEKLGAGVPDRAAVGIPGGIDQDVDSSEGILRGGDDGAAILDLGEIGRHIDRLGTLGLQRRLDPLAIGRVAPADHEAFGAALRQHMSDGLAQPLGPAGDDGHLAGEGEFLQALRHHGTHSRIVNPAAPKASARCRRPMAE